jgi:hypothetical protein
MVETNWSNAFSCSDIGGSSISALEFLSKYRVIHAEWYKAFSEDHFTIVTRSRASEIDWTDCSEFVNFVITLICKHKAFKHNRKMHKVFLMYQQVFLNGGNKLIECIFMLWHRRFLDLCFSISKQISCYTRWMIQSIFDKFITKVVTKHLPVNTTCQHVPTLNPHVRLQHHAIRINHQMKIISLLWHDLELQVTRSLF